MFSTPMPSVRLGLAAGLVLSLLVPGAVALAQEEAQDALNPTLAAFEELKAQVKTAVEEGRMEAAVAEQAEEIGFVLQKELIQSDAGVQVLLLEVKRFTGEEQEAALQSLVAAVAERERQIFAHLRQLESAAGLAAPPAEGKRKKKKGKLEVTFEPEDLTDPKDP